MREALKHALELNIAIETTETEESRQFNEILKNEGVKAAIDWRDRKLGYTGSVKRHDIG
jgi:enoyl-CoA hydratase